MLLALLRRGVLGKSRAEVGVLHRLLCRGRHDCSTLRIQIRRGRPSKVENVSQQFGNASKDEQIVSRCVWSRGKAGNARRTQVQVSRPTLSAQRWVLIRELQRTVTAPSLRTASLHTERSWRRYFLCNTAAWKKSIPGKSESDSQCRPFFSGVYARKQLKNGSTATKTVEAVPASGQAEARLFSRCCLALWIAEVRR